MAEINAGDTAWVLASSGLVMLMTPALGFFYGGLVRRKNVLATLMHSFFILALISVQWALWGYTLAFGPDIGGGIIGGLDWIGLRDVGAEPGPYAATIPHSAFMIFQCMFAVITPALITGAFAERKRFKAFVVFSLAWATFVYAPVAHWVWAIDGWLRYDTGVGALDFAGGTVVHINSGVAALICALMVGKRIGFGKEAMPPHSMPLTMVGAVLLWVGWFGFNAGSALAANGTAALAMANTFVATAAAGLSWMFLEWMAKGKPSLLGLASGAIAGLVAVTPAAGFAGPMGSMILGLIAGAVCLFFCTTVKNALGYDESLDVFGIHAIGGIVGSILTGVLVSTAFGGAGIDGYAIVTQVWKQLVAVGIAIAWSAVGTLVILVVLRIVLGLRPGTDQEREGLDLVDHGERAYNY